MRNTISIIIILLVMLSASACSLTGISTEAGKEAESTLQAGSLQDETAGVGRSSSVEETTSTDAARDALTDETASNTANTKLVKVVLFFAAKDNGALKEEEREVQVVDGAILKACVNALVEGPSTEGLQKTIPDGTVLRGISLKNKVATVDLSGEFAQATGTAGDTARISIVNTLTRINGVEKVRFHINGEELTDEDGTPLGEIAPVILNADGTPRSSDQN